MDKLTELRNRVQEVYQAGGVAPFAASFQDVVALLAHIERLNGALALAEIAIGGECDIPNNCEMCQAWRAIQAVKEVNNGHFDLGEYSGRVTLDIGEAREILALVNRLAVERDEWKALWEHEYSLRAAEAQEPHGQTD